MEGAEYQFLLGKVQHLRNFSERTCADTYQFLLGKVQLTMNKTELVATAVSANVSIPFR